MRRNYLYLEPNFCSQYLSAGRMKLEYYRPLDGIRTNWRLYILCVVGVSHNPDLDANQEGRTLL